NLPKTAGGGLTLFRSDLTTDNIKFGIQITDLTIGRFPDGSGGFRLTQPTAGFANASQDVGSQLGLKINEWMSTNAPNTGTDKNNDDWIEVYNPDPLPVPLGGLVLSDSSTNTLTSKILPALSF